MAHPIDLVSDPYLSRRSWSAIWPFSFSAFSGTVAAAVTGKSYVVKGVYADAVITTGMGAAEQTILSLTSSGGRALPFMPIAQSASAGTRISQRVEIPDGMPLISGNALALSSSASPSTGAIRISGFAWGDLVGGSLVDVGVGDGLGGARSRARAFSPLYRLGTIASLTTGTLTTNIWSPSSSGATLRIKGYSIAAVVASAFTLTASGNFGIRDTSSGTTILPLMAFPGGVAMSAGQTYMFNRDLGDGITLPAGKTAGIGFDGAITSGTFYVLGALWGSEE